MISFRIKTFACVYLVVSLLIPLGLWLSSGQDPFAGEASWNKGFDTPSPNACWNLWVERFSSFLQICMYVCITVVALVVTGKRTWYYLICSGFLRLVIGLNWLAMKSFDVSPKFAEPYERLILTAQVLQIATFSDHITREQIALQLLMAGIEPNPGPHHICKKCNNPVKGNMVAHMKKEHPIVVDCNKCGKPFDISELKKHLQDAHPFKKESSVKLIENQLNAEAQQEKGGEDASQAHVAEALDKKQDEKAAVALKPEVLIQSEIDLIELKEKLSVVEIKYTTPKTGLPTTTLDDGPSVRYSELGVHIEDVDQCRLTNFLHIGEVNEYYVSRQVITYGPIKELFWLTLYVAWIFLMRFCLNTLVWYIMPIFASTWVRGFLSHLTLWYIRYCALSYCIALALSWAFCSRTRYGNVKLPLCYFMGRLRTGVNDFYFRVLILLGVLKPHRVALIGRPTGVSSKEERDRRPELDRGEHFAYIRRQEYELIVAVLDPIGYRLYTSYPGLASQWYDDPKMCLFDNRLTTVVLDDGLMATALSRLTMIKNKQEPALALETCLRQLTANSAYQEDYTRLYSTGRSIYRDMAMVCGAIVAKDISYNNTYF